MKQALIVINEIKADYKAIQKSKSKYLINDKSKHIKKLEKELKDYCKFKNINYYELKEAYFNDFLRL